MSVERAWDEGNVSRGIRNTVAGSLEGKVPMIDGEVINKAVPFVFAGVLLSRWPIST